MTERSKALDKITKLLALAESENQHEAELAATRASELMAKYQIEFAEVLIKEAGAGSIQTVEYTVKGQRMKLQWIVILAYGCAQLFDGTVLTRPGELHGTSFTWVGTKEDIPLMKALFEHLYQSWFGIVESDLAVAKYDVGSTLGDGTWAPRDTMKFKAGHGLSYAQTVSYRCQALVRARNEEVTATTGTDLVVVKGAARDEWLKDNSRPAKAKKVSHGSVAGYRAGRAAGGAAALGGAIT
jgi:hypothetical protein